jgi:hypothetical protein
MLKKKPNESTLNLGLDVDSTFIKHCVPAGGNYENTKKVNIIAHIYMYNNSKRKKIKCLFRIVLNHAHPFCSTPEQAF